MVEKNEPLTLWAGVFGALASPLFGQYVIIVLCGLFGALYHLSQTKGLTIGQTALRLFLDVGLAVVFTSFFAWWIEQHSSIPATKVLGPLAFLLAWIGERWPQVAVWAFKRFRPKV